MLEVVKLIKEDGQKRVIEGQEKINFYSSSSLHLIVVTARVKGEKQLDQQSTDDEDLTVQVDGKSFPKLSSSNNLVDSPAAFSGGKQHNLSKTVYFLTYLSGRDHEIILKADQPPNTATIESVKIYTLSLDKELIIDVKNQAEDGDRRPWLTFAFDNMLLRSVTPTITYSRRKRDSDDVKITIDGIVQENVLKNIKHFLWRFVGSILVKDSSMTETETFTVNLPKGLHYVEFWADRMPTFHKFVINFGTAPLANAPTVDNPKWTGDFYDDTEEMLLARAIYGEASGESKGAKIAVAWTIRNRVEDTKHRWGTTYHEVILTKYQYEPFNDPNSDPFKKITQPPLGNVLEKQAWQDSYKVAESVFFDKEADSTKGANHFYVPSDQPKQNWVDEKKFTVQIGATRFYKL